MNARWTLLAGLIVATMADPAQAQGLLERLGKIAREASKAVDQPPPGAVPAPPPANLPPAAGAGDVAPAGYLGLTLDEPARGSQGAPVVGVREGSPAADAGFRPGDVVLSVDGAAINNLDDFQAAMTGLHAGDRVRIKYVRQGATQNVSVKLAERQSAPSVAGDPPAGVPFKSRSATAGTVTGQRASLGVTVMPLSDEARRRYGLEVARGALVTGVRPGGPAERAGIGLGTAIVAIDGKRVDAAEELIEQIAVSRPGQEVEITYYVRDRLQRKNVVLGVGDGGPVRTPEGVIGQLGDGDRPLLRKLEGVLDGLGAGRGGGVDVDVDATLNRPPAANGAANTEMRRQLEELQITVERLAKRVKELEAKVGAGNSDIPPPPPKNDGPPPVAPPLAPPKNG